MERARNFSQAAADFFIGALCLFELYGRLPAFSGVLMEIQFIVIHSFPFMVILVSGIERGGPKKAVFWGLFFIYALFAWQSDGAAGIAQFAALTFATYYGASLRDGWKEQKFPLVVRWAGSLLAFMVLAKAAGMSTDVNYWSEEARAPLFGALYFAALGCLELSGVYNRDWAAILNKLTGQNPSVPPGKDKRP
ncbi:MAG: hypothetical protein HY550_01995 [Elusimicrobia bacterium]|nr:hypothetical protein [Elusimicrobiota bacterium]